MKEVISKKQGIFLIAAFILDGGIVLPIAPEGGRNLWISIIIAILLSFILFSLYASINKLYPEKTFFEINQNVLGVKLGNCINLIYIFYFIHLGSLTLRDFGEFMNVLTMPETPKSIIMIVPALIAAYMVKKGVEVIGRFSLFASIFTLITILILAALLTPKLDITNILPIMGKGVYPVFVGAWSALTFPFGECVIFLCILSTINNSKHIKSTYFNGLILGGSFMLLTNFYEICVLGENLYLSLYFPSYAALSRIRIGDFIQRLEIIGGLNFNIFGLIKITICLYAASVGISKIFKVEDYTGIALPVMLIMFNFSNIIYKNVMEMMSWTARFYKYYALPFEIIIPFFIYIVANIRKKHLTHKSN